MVEGQGPVTPGNRRKRIGANSPACFAEDEIDLETLLGFFLLESGENHSENRMAADLLAKAADGMFSG